MSVVAKVLGYALVAVIALAFYISAFVLPRFGIDITQNILFYLSLVLTVVLFIVIIMLTVSKTPQHDDSE